MTTSLSSAASVKAEWPSQRSVAKGRSSLFCGSRAQVSDAGALIDHASVGDGQVDAHLADLSRRRFAQIRFEDDGVAQHARQQRAFDAFLERRIGAIQAVGA